MSDYGGEDAGGSDYYQEDTDELEILTEEANESDVDQDADVHGKQRRVKVRNEDRITSKFMTKYEKARILGARALQISKNAPLMIDPMDESDPYKLAEMELSQKLVPFIVRRYLPDGSYEDWKVSELYWD